MTHSPFSFDAAGRLIFKNNAMQEGVDYSLFADPARETKLYSRHHVRYAETFHKRRELGKKFIQAPPSKSTNAVVQKRYHLNAGDI
jgi:hypothetical protein